MVRVPKIVFHVPPAKSALEPINGMRVSSPEAHKAQMTQIRVAAALGEAVCLFRQFG
jgi:hypothetical protein